MQVAAAEGYRLWASTYDESPNPLLDLEAELVARHFCSLPGKLLADIGCGTGRWAEYAVDRGARVLAIDVSHEMLLQAAGKPHLRATLIEAAATSLPLPNGSADIVLSSFTISYVRQDRGARTRACSVGTHADAPPLQAFADETARIARPHARILITDLHPTAAAAGWKRTFRHADRSYELAHTNYTEQQILAAFAGAGLTLERSTEACFDESHYETFLRAGKASAFADACRIPAVWLGVWSKP